MSKKRYIIGIDFGGTYVKLARLSFHGSILEKRAFPTSDFKTKGSLIREILNQAECLIGKSRSSISGIGIGVPGQVDYQEGIVYNLTNVKGWKNAPLRDIMRKRLRLPVYLDNDANVAALGEMVWGAARGYCNIVCVTLGTGVGGGLIIDGEIYRGSNSAAGEIGHISIEKDGPRCNCGSRGCMEAFVGNRYIVKEVVKRLKGGERSILLGLCGGDFSYITPKLLDKAAHRQDNFSIRIWKEVGRNIGVGLVSIVNLLNPEIIVIGGGISKTGKLLFDAIRRTVRKRALEAPVKGLKIVPAKFVEDAGVVGAAALVRREVGEV